MAIVRRARRGKRRFILDFEMAERCQRFALVVVDGDTY